MLLLKPCPSFNRPSISRRPDSHTCFFLFPFIWRCLFSEYFLHHFRFLFVWTIEYVVRSFLPNGVFLLCDHGLISAYVRIQSINEIIAKVQ